MGGTDLLGLYWTVSGPVEVHFGREWSLFDLRDRCEQAARVGFSGIGLWHADLEHVLETRNLHEVRQLFDDNGLKHLRSEEHTSELQSHSDLVCRLLLEKKKKDTQIGHTQENSNKQP